MKLAVIMDPINEIIPQKDGTLDLLLEAQSRSYEMTYFEQKDLKIMNGKAIGLGKKLQVEDSSDKWFSFQEDHETELSYFDIILMRKDPPFNTEYIYATYILDLAAKGGSLVVNRPDALRNFNEKVCISLFPNLTPKTLISCAEKEIRNFIAKQDKTVVKPLDGMGGKSIFIIDKNDLNIRSILEAVTDDFTKTIMAQTYVPEITAGDKRIHIINGKHCEVLLARIPSEVEHRGNLVMGAKPEVQPLSDRDKEICNTIAPTLVKNGILFAGIDVIGDFLTEINITSPTGMREIDQYHQYRVSAILFNQLEKILNEK